MPAQHKKTPRVSVIIPTLKGGPNIPRLLEEIERQTFKGLETLVIEGIHPNGRARNAGVKKARGKYLVFIDDDAFLGHDRVIENLISPLEQDASIGMTGASVLLPEDANWLQRAFLNLRSGEFPVVKEIVDSDSAQHSCCALPKEVYKKVGWESDDLITGTDNDLRLRLHGAGYRVVVVPDTWVYHKVESTLPTIARKLLTKGMGAAYATKVHPEIFGYPVIGIVNYQIKTAEGALFYTIFGSIVKVPVFLCSLRVFQLFAQPVFTIGYIYGWFKFHKVCAREENPQDLARHGRPARSGITDKVMIVIIRALYGLPNAVLAFLRIILFRNEFHTKESARNILIYRTGTIGDLICAVPSMIAIKRHFPAARITLLTTPGRKELPTADEILGKPWYFDEVKTYYPTDYGSIKEYYNLTKELRAKHYDLFVALTWNRESVFTLIKKMLFAKAIGVSGVMGFRVRTIKMFSKTQSRLLPSEGEVESLLSTLRGEGIQINRVEFDLPIMEEDRRAVDRFLPVPQYKGERPPVVAINPGAKRRSNRWPIERFAQVGRKIKEGFGASIVVTGGPDDKGRGLCLKNEIGDDVIITAGMLRVRQTAELLRRCDLLISNDTGAIHLAAAVGTPVVAVFSPWQVRGKWYPYGRANTVLRGHAPCDHCLRLDCDSSECTESVTVEDVLHACEDILGKLQKGVKPQI
ncbi:MAG: glycosyltransferase [Planctomycetes bacterium]|nr:glycosyltransferase [Planctomycetota bacterium]